MQNEKDHNNKHKERNKTQFQSWENTLPEFSEEPVNASPYHYNENF